VLLSQRFAFALLITLTLIAQMGCGVKGPPLPPVPLAAELSPEPSPTATSK